MSIAYTFTSDGYFAGAIEDYGFLPVNATYTKTLADKEGFVQHWDGKKWGYVENNKGKSGYVDGKPFKVKEYGPLPAGWSETPPPPTAVELADHIRAERDGKLLSTDKYLIADFPLDVDKLEAVKAYRKALRDITKQEGFPHDIAWPKNPMD